MRTFFKILTLPIWLPFAILWFIAKLVAFAVVLVIVAFIVIYFAL
jgi:hypothetical protein